MSVNSLLLYRAGDWTHVFQPLALLLRAQAIMKPQWHGSAADTWSSRWQILRDRCLQMGFQAVREGICPLTITSPGVTSPYPEFDTHAWQVLPTSQSADFWLHGNAEHLAQFKHALRGQNPNAAANLVGLPDDRHWFWRECWEELGWWDYWWPAAWQTNPLGIDTVSTDFWSERTPIHISAYLGIRWPIWPVRRFGQSTDACTDNLLRWAKTHYSSAQINWLAEVDGASWTWHGSHQQTRIELPFVTITTMGDRHHSAKKMRYHTEHSNPSCARQLGSLQAPLPHWVSEDNDFRSRLCLDHAHAPIVATAATLLQQRPGAVLDLGCGNGYLLAKLQQHCPEQTMVGIEWLGTRQAHACYLLPHENHIYLGDMYADPRPWQRDYRLAILMAGRLTEVAPAKQRWLKNKLAKHCEILVVYLYSNWFEQWRLADLLTQVGLEPVSILAPGNVALARVSHQERHWTQGPALQAMPQNRDPRYAL